MVVINKDARLLGAEQLSGIKMRATRALSCKTRNKSAKRKHDIGRCATLTRCYVGCNKCAKIGYAEQECWINLIVLRLKDIRIKVT